jgi:hypothetical protein
VSYNLSVGLIQGCIESGKTREEGGAIYNNQQTCATAAADAGDSLAAIKKLVYEYEEQKVTMAQLCDALDRDFEGYKEILRMCQVALPQAWRLLNVCWPAVSPLISTSIDVYVNPCPSNYGTIL